MARFDTEGDPAYVLLARPNPADWLKACFHALGWIYDNPQLLSPRKGFFFAQTLRIPCSGNSTVLEKKTPNEAEALPELGDNAGLHSSVRRSITVGPKLPSRGPHVSQSGSGGTNLGVEAGIALRDAWGILWPA